MDDETRAWENHPVGHCSRKDIECHVLSHRSNPTLSLPPGEWQVLQIDRLKHVADIPHDPDPQTEQWSRREAVWTWTRGNSRGHLWRATCLLLREARRSSRCPWGELSVLSQECTSQRRKKKKIMKWFQCGFFVRTMIKVHMNICLISFKHFRFFFFCFINLW